MQNTNSPQCADSRSASMLKPPTKVTRSASSVSAISISVAMGFKTGAKFEATTGAALRETGNENQQTTTSASTNNNLSSPASSTVSTTTPETTAPSTVSGIKRKAVESAVNKKPRNELPRRPLSTTTSRAATGVNSARPTSAAAVRQTTTTRTPAVRTATAARSGIASSSAKRSSPEVRSTVGKPMSANTSATNGNRIKSHGTQSPAPAESSSNLAVPELAAVMAAKKKKRAQWDTKGRLEDMEEVVATLQQMFKASQDSAATANRMLENTQEENSRIQVFKQTLESAVAAKESENHDILRKMQALEFDFQSAARKHDDELYALKSLHKNEMLQLRRAQDQLQQETEKIQSQLRSTTVLLEQQTLENQQLRTTISTQSASTLMLESDYRALKMKQERTEDTLVQRERRIAELEQQLADSHKNAKELEVKIRNEESIRRRLHNTIQELKGNIRVFCRVRPVAGMTREEGENKNNSPRGVQASAAVANIKYPDQEGREIEFWQTSESALGSQATKSYPFAFDKVFQPDSKQEEVFEEISQLVQSALDGYNVCIFAYGQTGSGKTHTMEGPVNSNQESMGMIARSILQIYENASSLKDKGWDYTMEGQYVEIYNEIIHDLLGTGDITNPIKKHEIRHGPNNRTTITDITTVLLTSPERVTALLKKAAQNRSVGSTNMNDRSSRSHCVFTLKLMGKNSITGEASEGVLNLIDLAGSERLSQSGATGDRLKETLAINKSLSSLGDVIVAISKKESHVPYRNSKLTYLLQNSLGGNSKTLMFVNISPLASNLNETLCSLRFATKVNSCTIGTATKMQAGTTTVNGPAVGGAGA